MELMRIELADVRPDPNNPRDDFGDIESLAESFELNPAAPGEPLQPIVTVRDANVYRIVDGERRYRAMRKRGTESCWSNVCESMDEANSVVQMLATDDKMPLSEQEKSRGVQQMLLLGVPEEKVERSAKVKGVSSIRRVMRDAEEPLAMTIDWMLAVAEAEEAGDDEGAQAIRDAKPETWRSAQMKAQSGRQARQACSEAEQAARDAGLEVLPRGADTDGFENSEWVYGGDAEELAELAGRGYTHMQATPTNYGSASVYVYSNGHVERGEEQEDAESEAMKRAYEELGAITERLRTDRLSWAASQLAAGAVPPAIDEWCRSVEMDGSTGRLVRTFEEETGKDIPWKPSPTLAAAVLAGNLCRRFPHYIARLVVDPDEHRGQMDGFDYKVICKELELCAIFEKSGMPSPEYYAPTREALEGLKAFFEAEKAGDYPAGDDDDEW